ncbi:hypothetical protein E2P81_ATG05198 [Venturia nashicola]|nr:hypothetical protein E2P81_ATG05198 [Venturia nashicola]
MKTLQFVSDFFAAMSQICIYATRTPNIVIRPYVYMNLYLHNHEVMKGSKQSRHCFFGSRRYERILVERKPKCNRQFGQIFVVQQRSPENIEEDSGRPDFIVLIPYIKTYGFHVSKIGSKVGKVFIVQRSLVQS